MEKLYYIVIAIITISIIGISLYTTMIEYTNNKIIQIEVVDKYVKSEKYYVIANTEEGKESFQIHDLKFKFKFNSSNIYSNLTLGKKYKVKVSGKRIQLWSLYRNINEIMEEK